jgi:hypothetical protein
MSKNDNTKSKFSVFKFFTHEENVEVEDAVDNSFVGLARQLRVNEEVKAKETQKLAEEIGEYFAGVITEALHMGGTALGDRIHDIFMGHSHSSDNDSV